MVGKKTPKKVEKRLRWGCMKVEVGSRNGEWDERETGGNRKGELEQEHSGWLQHEYRAIQAAGRHTGEDIVWVCLWYDNDDNGGMTPCYICTCLWYDNDDDAVTMMCLLYDVPVV